MRMLSSNTRCCNTRCPTVDKEAAYPGVGSDLLRGNSLAQEKKHQSGVARGRTMSSLQTPPSTPTPPLPSSKHRRIVSSSPPPPPKLARRSQPDLNHFLQTNNTPLPYLPSLDSFGVDMGRYEKEHHRRITEAREEDVEGAFAPHFRIPPATILPRAQDYGSLLNWNYNIKTPHVILGSAPLRIVDSQDYYEDEEMEEDATPDNELLQLHTPARNVHYHANNVQVTSAVHISHSPETNDRFQHSFSKSSYNNYDDPNQPPQPVTITVFEGDLRGKRMRADKQSTIHFAKAA